MSWFDIPASNDLSEEQKVIYGLPISENLLLIGAAGSGKTVLAVYRAQQAIKEGKSVLFIVFTKMLRDFVEIGFNQLGLNDNNKKVEVKLLQDITQDIFGRRIVDFDASIYEQLINALPKYDLLIVDEGQDFSSEMYTNFFKKIANNFTFLADEKQKIYKEDFNRVVLTNNFPNLQLKSLEFTYRNPTNVLRLASDFYRNKLNAAPTEVNVRCYNEEKGEVKKFITKNEVGLIKTLIENKGDLNLGILLPRKNVIINLGLKLNNDYAFYDFEVYYNGLRDYQLSFNNNRAKIMPYWSAKGLQFDTVVIPFVSSDLIDGIDKQIFDSSWVEENKALYVALTRTKKNLWFIETNDSLFPYSEYLNSELITEVIDSGVYDKKDTGFVIDDDLPF